MVTARLQIHPVISILISELSSINQLSEIIANLMISSLQIDLNKQRIIESSSLPLTENIMTFHWTFPKGFQVFFQNINGHDVVLTEQFHISYLSKYKTRQGVNLFLKPASDLQLNAVNTFIRFYHGDNFIESLKSTVKILDGERRYIEDPEVNLELMSQNWHIKDCFRSDINIYCDKDFLDALYESNINNQDLEVFLEPVTDMITICIDKTNFLTIPRVNSFDHFRFLFTIKFPKFNMLKFSGINPLVCENYKSIRSSSGLMAELLEIGRPSRRLKSCFCGGKIVDGKCTIIGCIYN